MIQIIGYIARRRCIGKNLSFVDVQVDQIIIHDHDVVTNNNNNNGNDDSLTTTEAAAASSSSSSPLTTTTTTTIVEMFHKKLIGTIIEVVFKRDSFAWTKHNNDDNDNNKDDFPWKQAKLPHGGKILLNLATTEDEGRQFMKNNPKQDHDVYDVCSWKLLENPREKALEVATRNTKDGGGIDCPIYLKERHDAYSKFNKNNKDNSHKRLLLKTSSPSKKSKQKNNDVFSSSVVIDNPTFTTTNSTTNENNGTTTTTPQSNNNNNNNNTDNFSHGNNKAKSKRANIFASWLIQHMGIDNLKKGIGVVDIAGGKGKLSVELSVQGKIPCTIIDPLVRKHGKKLNPSTAKRLRKTNSPHPNLICKPFNQSSFFLMESTSKEEQEQQQQQTEEDDADADNQQENDIHDVDSNIDGSDISGEQTIRECSICVGLHPDEATEDILDVALQYNKSVAIVPCCVFSGFFPMRYLPGGGPVRTYEEFIQYLLNKDQRLQIQTLPFEGRNQVIYLFENNIPQNQQNK